MNYSEESLVKFFKKAKDIYMNDKFIYEDNLKNFFDKAKIEYKTYKQVKREIDRYLSTDFNFIKILSPDENKISDLIKILLEPNGIHGQGMKFLELFIKTLSSNIGKNFNHNLSAAKITREKSTDLLEKQNRRIDLFIDLREFIVAIENKPWAGEQEDQMGDYFEYLQKLIENKHINDFLLIYLHGTGEKPTSIKKEIVENNKDRLLFTSYQNLLKPWLEECYKECESQKVRFFIKDFIDWINENFKENKEELNYE